MKKTNEAMLFEDGEGMFVLSCKSVSEAYKLFLRFKKENPASEIPKINKNLIKKEFADYCSDCMYYTIEGDGDCMACGERVDRRRSRIAYTYYFSN